jgi:phosphoheptose isomerase
VDQIVGAEAVRRHGGRVVSLPLVPGYSTTALIERIRGGAVTPPRDAGDDVVARALGEHREVAESLLAESGPAIRAAGEGLAGALRTGARLCVFGDDESALAVQHFERTFSGRLGTRPERGDVALALSASGESSAVLAGVMSARERGCLSVGLTGAGGKRLASLCDLAVLVPSDHAPRVREAHVLIGHLWGELLDG